MKGNFSKEVAFSVKHAPLHVRAFYGRLIEYLSQELDERFAVIDNDDYDEIIDLDGRYKLVLFCTRGAAAQLTKLSSSTKSFLVDHGPIHTNRAPHGTVDFEIFSSEYLRNRYSEEGFKSKVRSWSGGYFITDHLVSNHIKKGECLVYCIHNVGWYANSMVEVPFSDEETITYLNNLSELFNVVHVVSHINAGKNFVDKYRSNLLPNVVPVSHGFSFMSLIASVEAVFMEYSSVISCCLWNPYVKIFVRYPKYPLGPITLQARYLHELMNDAAYPIINDSVKEVENYMISDKKSEARHRAKLQIFDDRIDHPYYEVLRRIREALEICDALD